MHSRLTRIALVVVCFLVMGCAVGFGIHLFLRSDRAEKARKSKIERTNSVIAQMNTIIVGDTIADAYFEDLKGQELLLSQVLPKNGWIGVIEPECESCRHNLSVLQPLLSNKLYACDFLFISPSDPSLLKAISDSIQCKSQILYDRERTWVGQQRIFTFPFFLQVGSDMRVLDIVVGELDIERAKGILKR